MTGFVPIFLNYICPSIGAVLSTLMFGAPMKSLRMALERGSLSYLNPTPWVLMTGNCIGWIGYSYLKHDIFVLLANGPGLLISLWLNFGASKLQHLEFFKTKVKSSKEPPKEYDSDEVLLLDGNSSSKRLLESFDEFQITTLQERRTLLIIGAYAFLFSALSWSDARVTRKVDTLGVAVNANLVFFYGAPLSTIYAVITQKNSAYVHYGTMLLGILNTSFWLAYGLAIIDWYICLPNGIGLCLGLMQAFLCAIYERRDDDIVLDNFVENDDFENPTEDLTMDEKIEFV